MKSILIISFNYIDFSIRIARKDLVEALIKI